MDPDELITITAEELEQRLTGKYLLGVSAGFDRLIKQLRTQAGEAFANGADDRAKLLRDIANDLVDGYAKKTRKEWIDYEKEHGINGRIKNLGRGAYDEPAAE